MSEEGDREDAESFVTHSSVDDAAAQEDAFVSKSLVPAWMRKYIVKRKKGEQGYTTAMKGGFASKVWIYALVFFQCMEIIMFMALLSQEDERLLDEPDVVVKFQSDYPSRIINAQYIVAFFCFVAAVFGLVFTFMTFVGDNVSRLFDLVLLKGLTVLADMFLMAFFVYSRMTLICAAAAFQVLTVIVVFKLNYKVNSASIDQDSLRDVPTIMRSLLKMRSTKNDVEGMPLAMHLLERLLTWLSGYDAARTFSGDGRKKIVQITFMMFILYIGLFSYNHQVMKTNEQPIMELADLNYVMENPKPTRLEGWSYTGDGDPVRVVDTSQYGAAKVVVLLVDGLSYNQMNTSTGMQDLVDDFGADSLLIKMRADIPTDGLPTWQQIISGVRPQSIGTRGTSGLGNPKIDTIFHQMNRSSTPFAVASVPWFTSLFNDAMTSLDTDGSISAEFRTDPCLEKYIADQDPERAKNVIDALNSPVNYGLVFGHLLSPNYHGHFFGTDSDEFRESVNQAADVMRDIITNATDPGTVVVMLSNHGHLVGGGSGGGSNNVVHVPLFVYKKDSLVSENDIPSTYPRNFHPEGLPRLYDMASSLAAMIGVPVPRHNEGYFINHLISNFVHPEKLEQHQTDLFYQHQAMTDRWMRKVGYDPGQSVFADTYLTDVDSPGPVEGVFELVALHNETGWQAARNLSARNVGASMLLITLSLVILLYIIQVYTIADPFSIINPYLHDHLTAWERADDVRCFKLAFLCVVAYWGSVFGIWIFIAFIVSQGEYDACYLHRMRMEMVYVFSTFVPGIVGCWVISRIIGLAMSSIPEQEDEELYEHVYRYVMDLFFAEIEVTESALHHLLHLYLLYLAAMVQLWIVFSASIIFCFVLPPTFRIPYLINAESWQAQFQLNTAIGLGMPLFAYAGVQVYMWSYQKVDNYVLYEMNRLKTDKAQRYRDSMTIDLGASQKSGWELPNVNDLENPAGTKHFERLSDWCLDVSASYTLTSAEKRRLIGEQFQLFSQEARHAGQEKGLILHQLNTVSEDFEEGGSKVFDMEQRIADNEEIMARGLGALRDVIDKDMEVERKALASKGRKPKWTKDPKGEANKRMGEWLITRYQDHEEQKLEVLIESRKSYLHSKNQSQKERDIKEIRKQQRDVVEQTMQLITKHEQLDNEVGTLNAQLDEIVARIKEFEIVKKRIAEGISDDILVHQKIQREIMEELKKEADYHMYVHNLIDSVTEDINDKEGKITQANTDIRDIEEKIERVIEKLMDRIETARAQKMALFREVKMTVDQLTKTKKELRDNRKWAMEYKSKLQNMSEMLA